MLRLALFVNFLTLSYLQNLPRRELRGWPVKDELDVVKSVPKENGIKRDIRERLEVKRELVSFRCSGLAIIF